MTTKTVSLLILNPRSGQPQHCVAAAQLLTRTLPKVNGQNTEWLKYEVVLEGSTIALIKSSSHSEAEKVFATPGETVSIIGIPLMVGDHEKWKRIDATSRPPVYAMLSALQGNTEDPDDGPFAMSTIKAKPDLRLVGA